MPSTTNTSPEYDGTGYLKMESGNIVLSENDILSEVLERLRSRRETYPFAGDYGSNLYLILNGRGINSGQVTAWAREALIPMVINGRITNDILVNSVILGNSAKISITVTAVGGESVTAIFSTFLLS